MTAVQHIPEELRATILVVDDTAASRYISGSWLRRSGHRVIEAATGTEALAALAATEVDLVLLDVGLPDMSGFDVCERIKSDPALARPVIHLSATAIRGADRAQGLTRGADAYLTEPVEPDELLATVTWPWCSPPASAAASGGCSAPQAADGPQQAVLYCSRTAVSFQVAPEQLCDALIERFGQDKPDDVALLVLRRP